ncbi:MAG: hypothetical protein KME45_26150 [Stenomitos rutilans HA7619-LM2]|jgi:hypothetical protein|nr:hypothetical protein [Stenomitos rutilans HA7619-LM2]
MNANSVCLTIHLTDCTMTDEERNDATRRLLQQLNTMDEVSAVHRVADPKPAPGHKAIAGTLIGLLSAEATAGNAFKVLAFMGDRWGDKPIALEIESSGRKLKITASSREEFAIALKAAQDFIVAQEAIQATTQVSTQKDLSLA